MKLIVNKVLNMIYPRCCPICHKVLQNQERFLCPSCEQKIRPIRKNYCFKCGKPVENSQEYCQDCAKHGHAFEQGRGIFVYDDIMRASLVRYKYYGCREYGDFYAKAMCAFAKKELLRWHPQLIVPVPLHKSKLRMRGFNQAEYLAERISARTGIPVDGSLVQKVKKTKSQKKLNAYQRKQNLKNAFIVKAAVNEKRILVIDDVYTTGSTMDAMAECLEENGAAAIFFLTVCIGKKYFS